jgi:hypothetical protein
VTKRKISKHTVTWTHPITGKPRSLELTHTRDYLHAGNDHLEIRSIRPRDAPHPLSSTGYLSHFINAGELKAKGGAVRFVSDWLASEAKSRAFIAAEQKRLQGDLFSWAERRHPSPRKPPRPPSTPRRSPPRYQR